MLVFDAMSAEEFKKQDCKYDYVTRRADAELMLTAAQFKYFELLPILYVGDDTARILELLDEAIANQEEGVMINICDAKYEFGRTWNLMKVKKMNTLDLEIVGYEEGAGRLAGTLGAIHVRYKDGNVVKVGSGFTDELRALIWVEPSDFIGKIVEIQYLEESTNADGGISLRFPVFKDFRPDKLTPDF
jgi:DNA ligase-1